MLKNGKIISISFQGISGKCTQAMASGNTYRKKGTSNSFYLPACL